MKSYFILLLVFAVLPSVCVGGVSYEGFALLEVGPIRSKKTADFINSIVDQDDHSRQIVMLNEMMVKNGSVELVVRPKRFLQLTSLLRKEQLPFQVLSTNFQKLIDDQVANRQKVDATFGTFKHDQYLTYSEQMTWLTTLASQLPSLTRLFSIGNSYEGRKLNMLVINEKKTTLPVIYVDSGMHAREWLSPASNMYIIEQILTGTSSDAVAMRNNYRWYFLLNVNPDGYQYTWTGGDRLWRKTRSLNAGSKCVGTDPNRNWDANWSGPGASGDPCSDTYYGTKAFSEIEISSESNFLKTISSTSNLFITLHAYSQLWLFPWGAYTYHPSDYDELMRVAKLAVSAVKSVNGLTFTPGTPADLIYVASGGSMDWTKQSNKMKYGYAPELRPLNSLQGGFTVPPTNIVPSGKEIFAGIVACAKNVQHKL